MDMRYHWLKDRVRQKQFDVYWRPGTENLGDLHTKHQSAQYQINMRQNILHEANCLNVLRGCIKPLPHPQARMHANTLAQRLTATRLRDVLARVHVKHIQNMNMN